MYAKKKEANSQAKTFVDIAPSRPCAEQAVNPASRISPYPIADDLPISNANLASAMYKIQITKD
jgi:hypothetical protein